MCLSGIERSGKDIELEFSGRLSAHMRQKKKKKKKKHSRRNSSIICNFMTYCKNKEEFSC